MTTITTFEYAGYEFKYAYNASDLSGQGCITEIVTHNDYLLNSFAGNINEIFVDIGANVGVATIIMAKLNPQSIVHAFEPFKECFDVLLKNIELNNLTNVVAHNIAVSDKDIDKVNLAIYGSMSGANTLYADGIDFEKFYGGTTSQQTSCIAFDTFIKNNNISKIKLLKIDCEGAEYDILYGSSNVKSGVIENMVGEFHNFKNLTGRNVSSELQVYCRPYIQGLMKISTLDLTDKY